MHALRLGVNKMSSKHHFCVIGHKHEIRVVTNPLHDWPDQVKTNGLERKKKLN